MMRSIGYSLNLRKSITLNFTREKVFFLILNFLGPAFFCLRLPITHSHLCGHRSKSCVYISNWVILLFATRRERKPREEINWLYNAMFIAWMCANLSHWILLVKSKLAGRQRVTPLGQPVKSPYLCETPLPHCSLTAHRLLSIGSCDNILGTSLSLRNLPRFAIYTIQAFLDLCC